MDFDALAKTGRLIATLLVLTVSLLGYLLATEKFQANKTLRGDK